jgi:hypothetical protein
MYYAPYELLKDYIKRLNKVQNTDFVPVLYPKINDKKSKLEKAVIKK